MCKIIDVSGSMANTMAEHREFLEECERRFQKIRITSKENREAIKKIAEDIEKMTTEVKAMITMAHEDSKTTKVSELEQENVQLCTEDAMDNQPNDPDDYPDDWEDSDDWDDYPDDWEDPNDWDDYPDDWEDPNDWDDYPDDWEDPYDPDDYPDDWEHDEQEDDSDDWGRDDWEDDERDWGHDDWEELVEQAYRDYWEDPDNIDNYFDGEFLPEKAGIYASWRGREYVSNMPKAVKASSARNAVAEEAAEESTDPLWDCWYNVAQYYEPDDVTRQVKDDEWRATIEELWDEVLDMGGLSYEDLIADDIYFVEKLIQRGQVAKRRKKTYWHERRLQRNALVIVKNYGKRLENVLYMFWEPKIIRTERIMDKADRRGWIKISVK